MIHFNELYITEDGKNLVIDTGIDDFDVYKDCYITSISIQSKTNCVSSNPYKMTFTDKPNKPIDALLQGGIIMVDMDEDGIISYHDEEVCSRINNILSRLHTDLTYDFNDDGTVNQLDLKEMAEYLVGRKSPYPSAMDITKEGEFNIADINAFIDIIETRLRNMNYSEDDISAVKHYLNEVRSDSNITEYRYRRIRKCISINQLSLILNEKVNEDTLFVVTVEAAIGGDASIIESLGCGWDVNVIHGLAYNTKKLYDTAVNFASSYGDTCDTDNADKFVDFILRYNAFIYAIKCGDIDKACYYWNNYLTGFGTKQMFAGGGCGCHGTHR